MTSNIIELPPLSTLWASLLENAKIPKEGVIIEFAPGFKSKIGNAVGHLRFRGSYHIIEPNAQALDHCFHEYRKKIPLAKIYCHTSPLHELISAREIPIKADALLANHALDDMILSLAVSPRVAEQFFSMNSGPKRIDRTRELWSAIEEKELYVYSCQIARDVFRFIEGRLPKFIALSHYEGKSLVEYQITKPTVAGAFAIQALQKLLSARISEKYLSVLKQANYGTDWVIHDRRYESNGG